MSRFFPHTAYAEDQPLPKTILTTHVLHRGFQSGAFTGLAIGSARLVYANTKTSPAAATTLPDPVPITPTSTFAHATHTSSLAPSQAATRRALPVLLHSTAIGAVACTALMSAAVFGVMRGKEDIEWSDRSWRLLENKGQVEVDDWGLMGTAVGAVAGVRLADVTRGLGWRGPVGGAALGSVVGVVGYMGWRHGLHGGKWD